MTLTVFKAGNTWAVSVPRELAIKLNIKPGDKIEPYLTDQSIAYRPVKKAVSLPAGLRGWIGRFEKKHSKALKELAER